MFLTGIWKRADLTDVLATGAVLGGEYGALKVAYDKLTEEQKDA